MSRLGGAFVALAAVALVPTVAGAEVLVDEHFDDANLVDRGWFDLGTVDIAPAGECSLGACLRYQWNTGDVTPQTGGMRILFAATDVVYVRYMARYSDGWQFRPSFGPHELYLLTDVDPQFIGPAATHLTAYIEHTEGVPTLLGQDALNIDESNIDVDLSGVTDNRSVMGCNGSSDGHGPGDCYPSGAGHNNGKRFGEAMAPTVFVDSQWHEVVVAYRLNDAEPGSTTANGHAKYWFDGEPLIDLEDVAWRTGQHPDMAFVELLIGPFFHDGVPAPQAWYIDELVIGTQPQDVGLDGDPPGGDSGDTGGSDGGTGGGGPGDDGGGNDDGADGSDSGAGTGGGASGSGAASDGPGDGDAAGCGCGAGARPGAWWAIVAFVWLGRRR